jgi:membrane-associated PAP2 superfamily phosphatase
MGLHAWLLPLACILASVALEYSGLDPILTGHFFDAANARWPFRDSWLFSDVLHTDASRVSAALYVMVLAALVASLLTPAMAKWRRTLLFLGLATASGPLIVGALKSMTHIYVPWHLALFGGDQPYIRLFDPVGANAPVGHAFPGGHSSGGFAWVSVYFAMRAERLPGSRIALAAALSVGALFSMTQMIRGAHFPSHDFVSLALCWVACVSWSWLLPRRATAPAARAPVRSENAPDRLLAGGLARTAAD